MGENQPETARDLAELQEKHQREKEAYEDTIKQKNAEIDQQRIQLKRYEFSLKEAVLFLKKPMSAYDKWLNGQPANPIEELHQVLLKVAEKNGKQVKDKQVLTSDDMTPRESVGLECIRLALNYLENAQKYVEAVDRGEIVFQELAPLVANENEALFLAKEQTPTSSVPTSIHNSFTDLTGQQRVSISPGKRDPRDIDLDEGDIGGQTNRRSNETTPVSSNSCSKCRDYQLQMDALSDKIRSLETEKNLLDKRVQTEIKSKQRLQKAKEVMDQELEDLTSTLFDQANQMVIQEARVRDDLNTRNKELSKTIKSLNARLQMREDDLVQLKKALYAKQEATDAPKDGQVDPKTPAFQGYKHSIVSGFDEFRSFIAVDSLLFQEFQEYVKAMMLATGQPAQQAMTTTLGTTFVKRCMLEDVEPCLYYSYQFSSQVKYGTGLTQSMKKKMMDCMQKCQFEVRLFVPEKIVSKDQESSHKGTPSFAFKDKCNLCTIDRDCEYQAHFGTPDKNGKIEWLSLCRFCRDRAIAVFDFFNFLSYSRQGLVGPGKSGATILSLFRQVLWLRRRMHIAKVGSCSLFESEASAVTGPGGGGDWEKYTTILY
ncbi:hypothetical protein EDD86DRAFT_271005 [Gorgonomyces haynaldii]|nr:hypothetical protein EDD86DRAFT_271005 [Gorgonomyces haynaldii]